MANFICMYVFIYINRFSIIIICNNNRVESLKLISMKSINYITATNTEITNQNVAFVADICATMGTFQHFVLD